MNHFAQHGEDGSREILHDQDLVGIMDKESWKYLAIHSEITCLIWRSIRHRSTKGPVDLMLFA